jgi:hypothetical protein
MTLLTLVGIVFIIGDSRYSAHCRDNFIPLLFSVVTLQFSILRANMAQPIPGGWGLGLLFGFSQGMLGVTGFETAANYIEEQRKGVYVKTLRNMCVHTYAR